MGNDIPIVLKTSLSTMQIILRALNTAPGMLPYNVMQQVVEDIQSQVNSQINLHNAAVKELEPPDSSM